MNITHIRNAASKFLNSVISTNVHLLPVASRYLIPVVSTKLHRPPVARDFVCRQGLCDKLDESTDNPLTLVSAPAGYGKSSFVSHWVNTRDNPNAWLSIDKTDSDVRVFLSYVVAAVQTVLPKACTETLLLLKEEVLPPLSVLAGSLGNDLDALEESLILVLDDYDRIDQPAVHKLVDHLLKHPPNDLQLVIITRRDPPLLLGALRAHNNLTEVRMRDLMFTRSETVAFLEQVTGQTFSSTAIDHLQQITEGWVVGLRLAVLALQHHSDADAYLRGFDCDASGVKDYLVEEVLARLPPDVADRMCKVSILNRFCAPLCEAVGAAPVDGDEKPLDGAGFIKLLGDSGLFCVSLDEHGEWYRYHHIFQELLQQRLKKQLTWAGVASLHRQASAWFEAHGLLEEAIHHAHLGDGSAEVVSLMVRNRNEILNQDQWYRLSQWLKHLPAEVLEDNPHMLMLKAWHLQKRARFTEVTLTLDRIEALLDNKPSDMGTAESLRGAIEVLRSHQRYAKGQGELAIKGAERGLKLLPPECLSERSYALMILGGALQMFGDLEGARARIHSELSVATVSNHTHRHRLLATLCVINWIAADLPSVYLVAEEILELGQESELKESIILGNLCVVLAHYQQNELAKAEALLMPAFAKRNISDHEVFTKCTIALASVYQATGQADKARKTVQTICGNLMRAGNTALLQRALAFQADLALRDGHMAEALSWAQQFDPEPFQANYPFYEPRLTLVKVLIAQHSAESLEQAESLLTRLEIFFGEIHNTRFLIEVLALQALLRDTQGGEPAAISVLGRAVQLAQPSEFIRLFVDLGPGLVNLLNRLDLDAEGKRYVGRILDVYRSDVKAEVGEALEHPLTKRELDVIELLEEELSNEQIADRLYIARATVKRHTENIYQKLGVAGRHQAVAQAKELAIIQSD